MMEDKRGREPLRDELSGTPTEPVTRLYTKERRHGYVWDRWTGDISGATYERGTHPQHPTRWIRRHRTDEI